MTEPHQTRDISASFPLLRLAPPLELRFSGQEAAQGVISGHASIFVGQPGGGPDSYGDVIAQSAFKATIAAHAAAGTMPVMLWSHDPAHPVGRWIDIREDDRGLFVRGQLNLQTSAGREAFEHLKARDIGGLSIGFQIAEGGFQRQADGSRLLTAIELFEISLCAMPAARAARITEIKSDPGSRQELFTFLHQSGLSRAASKSIAAGGWPALSGQDNETKFDALARRIEAALAEIRSLNSLNRHY
jgi:Escherichia/Staphylococcus phage prohead protease